MEDLMNSITPRVSIAPYAGASDNTAHVGAIIDRQGYESLTYLITTGVLSDADATFTVLLEDGEDPALADAATVTSAGLLGTAALASFTFADDNKSFKLGYVGEKRYTRLTITPANNTGAHFFSAVAVLGEPALCPTVNPPV